MKVLKQTKESLDEKDLLKKANSESGLDSASELFQFYLELVYGVCLKYLKDSNKAEDACMDIYHEFVKKIKEHDVENLKSWLYVLTKNHCLGKLRKEKRDQEKFEQFTLVYSDDYYHPLKENQSDEKLQNLKDCLDRLNDIQGQCIRLFYYEKESYQDISEILQMPRNKIRSHIQNGRRNLKNCMEKK